MAFSRRPMTLADSLVQKSVHLVQYMQTAIKLDTLSKKKPYWNYCDWGGIRQQSEY